MLNKKLIKKITIAGALLIFVALLGISIWSPSAIEDSPVLIDIWGEQGAGPKQFQGPIGITGQEGLVIISDTGNSRLQVFNEEGKLIRTISHERMVRPMQIALHDDRIYVPEYQNDLILIFNLSGELLQTIGSNGKGAGEFDAPAGVAVDSEERIYVADFYNHRIQIFDRNGNFLKQIGITGEKSFLPGRFNYPTDVEISAGQKIIVADAYNDRIQVFSADGELMNRWGGPFGLNISGGLNGWFRTATGVDLGPKDEVFVADFYNNRVQKFTHEGKFLASIKGPKKESFDRPTASFSSPSGRIFIVDFGNHQIKVFQKQNVSNTKEN